jgi:4-amino-4-deoxy-L-arabinose transferase-like glycosyltransferase
LIRAWKSKKVPLLLGAAFLLLNLIGLDRSPVVWQDEATLNDPAKELAWHGRLRSSVFAPFVGFDQAYFWQPPGATLVTALSYKAFGFGIWQTRVPGLIFGAGVIFLLSWLATRLFNSPRAGFFAGLIFALDPQFIICARSGRMDTQCLFLVLAGVLLHLRAEAAASRRWAWHLASGLAVGLAGLAHPLALPWALALLAMILLLGETKRWANAGFFALGAGLAPGCWLAYALRTPQLWMAQFLHHGKRHLAQGGLWTRLAGEVGRYLELHIYLLVPFLLVTYFGSWLWLVLGANYPRRTRLQVSILFLVPFLFNALLMAEGSYYFLYPVLGLAVAAGAWLAEFWPRAWARPATLRTAALAVFCLLLAGNVLGRGLLGRWLALAYQWQARDYYRQVEVPLEKILVPGDVVWGRPESWYAVEKAGATLVVVGQPDPEKHDYVVIKPEHVTRLGPGYHKIADIGQPLPPIFGRWEAFSGDYQMQIWKSDRRPPPRPAPEAPPPAPRVHDQ